MDPDTEEHYRELLKEWKRDEDSIKEKLEEMERMLEFSLNTDRRNTFGTKNCLDKSMLQVVGHMISVLNCRRV